MTKNRILSVPSFIIPGTYLENIRFIDSLKEISNIELLFFSFDADTRDLLLGELGGIGEYKGRFSFTAHLPDPILACHRDLVEILVPIVDRFVVHVPEDRIGFKGLLQGWIGEFGNIFQVENVPGRAFSGTASVLPDAPLCCDTGHLLLNGQNPSKLIGLWEERISEVHLHGVCVGRDHYPVNGDEEWFKEIIPFLGCFSGIIHMEVFDYQKLKPMIDLMVRIMQCNGDNNE